MGIFDGGLSGFLDEGMYGGDLKGRAEENRLDYEVARDNYTQALLNTLTGTLFPGDPSKNLLNQYLNSAISGPPSVAEPYRRDSGGFMLRNFPGISAPAKQGPQYTYSDINADGFYTRFLKNDSGDFGAPQARYYDPSSMGSQTQQVTPGMIRSKGVGSSIPQGAKTTKSTMENKAPYGYDKPLGFAGRSEYVPTQAITPDIVNHPAFRAFQNQLGTELGRQSTQIADEMSRRGILSSGASQDAYAKMAEGAQRATASEMGRLAENPLQASILQQAIYDPQRRQEFQTSERDKALQYLTQQAAERTGFGERQAGRDMDYNKWILGLGAAEAEKKQRANEFAEQNKQSWFERMYGVSKDITAEEQAYQNELRNMEMQNWANRMASQSDAMKNFLGLGTEMATGINIRDALKRQMGSSNWYQMTEGQY